MWNDIRIMEKRAEYNDIENTNFGIWYNTVKILLFPGKE